VTAPAAPVAPATSVAGVRGHAADLARAAGAPVVCGIVVIVLLAAWVIAGGGGAISRVRVEVTRATVPMVSYTRNGAAGKNALVYLTIRNLSKTPDVLLSAASSAAAGVVLTRHVTAQPAADTRGLVVPAGGTLTLSPFAADLVLIRPKSLVSGQDVVITLRFRNAGTVTVDAAVTPPGTP
jgi:copper(I)-binding protein